MGKKKEFYEITARITSTCSAAETVKGMVEKTPNPKIKTIVGNKDMGGYPMYLDSEDADNQYAVLKGVTTADGTALTDAQIQELLDKAYEIKLGAVNGNVFTGTLNMLGNSNAAAVKNTGKISEVLQKAMDKRVKENILSKDEAEAKIRYMVENFVDEDLILRVIEGWKKYPKSVHQPSCLYVDPHLEDSRKLKIEGIIAEGLRNAVSRVAVILEGDKSVGKNVYAETIAWLLNMPLFLITFSRQMSPSSVYGEKSTDNSAADELRKFDPDILKKAADLQAKRDFMIKHFAMMRIEGSADEQLSRIAKMMDSLLTPEENEILAQAERFKKLQAQSAAVNIVMDQSELCDWLNMGGLMVFNEMNMAEPNFFASFTNQLLDGTGFLFVPGRGEMPIHPDCVLIGTQNADYEGVEQQNEATMSRFNCLAFKQPASIKGQLKGAVESALKKSGYEKMMLSEDYFNQAQSFYTFCKKSVDKGQISNACLNIRGFVRALRVVAESNHVASLRRWIEICVINTCPVDERDTLITSLKELVTL